MATAAADASSSENATAQPPRGVDSVLDYHLAEKLKTLGEETALPWMDYALEQAHLAQKTIAYTVENAIDATRSRLDRIRTTSAAHFNQTLDSLQDVKSELRAYEDVAFGKVKEVIHLAASNQLITIGSILGVGLLGLKRPRRYLYYKIRRHFVREEELLSRADAKVKELLKSFDHLKAEAEKLEKAALQAEEEMTRGRTKLRQAGKQIQGVVNSAYKIEKQAGGLKDVLRDLPSIEASRFRSQVSNLAKEAKRERKVLTKEVTKISNYGISV